MLSDGGSSVVGSFGSDQASFIWSLDWWPHAIQNGLNPLLVDLVYAPDGWNMAWTSAIPGPALLAWPLTATVGPIVAYDVLALAAPTLAAWCTFLLCREAGTGTWPAVAGGLVFGFGSYEAAETLNHLNLALVFTLPLAALVVARHLRGALSDRWYVALLALCTLGIFATFLETLFWATLGGAFALGAGILLTRGSERALLLRTLLLGALAYVLALLVASPYLYIALAHPDPLGISGRGFELDLANLFVPTRVTAIRPILLRDLADQLGGQNLTEQVGYLGPVLPFLAGFALWERRRQPLARVLALTILGAGVAALGTQLVFAGHRTRLPLPWTLVGSLPLASHALTARAFVLVWLALAVVVALFLSSATRLRWLIFGLMAVTLVPNPARELWVTKLERPALFQEDRWRAVVRPGESVLNIPFGFEGRAMLWQQESGFGFRMAGGYVTATQPDSVWRYPIVRSFFGAPMPPFPGRELRQFARARQVDVVLMPDDYTPPWPEVARSAFGKPREVGGMLAWRLRGTWPKALGQLP